MKTIKGILFAIFFMSYGFINAQWIVLDTILSYQVYQWESYHNISFDYIDDGCIVYSYLFRPPTPSAEGSLYLKKTNNDGLSWATIFYDSGWGVELLDFDFVNSDTGFISYNYPPGINFERTISGGSTWEYISNNGPYQMYFINGMKGYGIQGSYFKRYENDTLINVDTLETYIYDPEVIFAKTNIGYCMHAINISEPRRYLMRTLDDGDNWNLIFHKEQRVFSDINVVFDSICIISCDSGYLYKTVDFGESWSEIKLNTDQYIFSISFINNTIGYALCGNSLFRTDDGGFSWSSHALPSNISFYSNINMINENVGYMNATNSSDAITYHIILKTENGGFTAIGESKKVENQLIAYPNPFTGFLSIELKPQFTEIDICDLNGLTVYSNNVKQANDQKLTIDLGNLENGVYIIRVKTKNSILTKKLIKI